MAEAKNDFTKGSVSRAITRMALPMTAAQLVNILYNIVDRMYIGRLPGVGRLALTGVGLVLPVISIIIGFANLCGTGGAPLCSICRGKGDNEEAEWVQGNSFALLLGLGVVLTALILLFREPILYLFGASDATFGYANTYLTIYTAGTFFALMATGMNSFLIAQGFSGLGMATVMLGAVLNIILDPIFIFGLHLDVAGAALATVLSQMASCAFVLLSLRRKRMPVRLRWGRMELHIVRRVLAFGLSPFLIIATDSILLIVLNTVLQRYGGPELGDTLVTCATIVQSYLLLITMPMGGLTLGSQPVVSFNYGARQRSRITGVIHFALVLSAAIMAVGTVVFLAIPGPLLRLFDADAAVLAEGISALRLIALSFVCAGVSVILCAALQALGAANSSLVVSLLRQLVLLFPLALLLGALRPSLVWLAFLLSEGAACLTALLLYRRTARGRLAGMEE